MALTYRKLETIADYDACEDLQKKVWEFEEREIVPTNELITVQMYGGFVAGAFEPDGRMVGFVYGLPGIKDGKLIHCSRMLGVLNEYRNENVGFQLKLMQREFAQSMGISLAVWTFDPLVGRNAYFNIEKLGVTARTYHCNLYGTSTSRFSSGLETDRLVAEWELKSKRVEERIAGRSDTPKLKQALREYPIVNRVERKKGGLIRPGEPDLSISHSRVLVEIPEDIQPIKDVDISLAREWREKIRRIFLHYLGLGYVVVGLVSGFEQDERRNLYILEKGRDRRETRKIAFAETGSGVFEGAGNGVW